MPPPLLVLVIGHSVLGLSVQFMVSKVAVLAISVICGLVWFDVEFQVMLRLGR